MADAAPGEIRAAGAVLWRARAGGIETALVHRPRYDDWSFPKGKSMPGEHMLLTAVREVEEETGVRAALGRRLPTQSYPVNGRPKRVEYWAARPVSAEPFTPGTEVDELGSLPLPGARERLSYPRDVALLDSFTSGSADSAPVILLRHASAIAKQAWQEAGHHDERAGVPVAVEPAFTADSTASEHGDADWTASRDAQREIAMAARSRRPALIC